MRKGHREDTPEGPALSNPLRGAGSSWMFRAGAEPPRPPVPHGQEPSDGSGTTPGFTRRSRGGAEGG
jgi:hypothetical protein